MSAKVDKRTPREGAEMHLTRPHDFYKGSLLVTFPSGTSCTITTVSGWRESYIKKRPDERLVPVMLEGKRRLVSLDDLEFDSPGGRRRER